MEKTSEEIQNEIKLLENKLDNINKESSDISEQIRQLKLKLINLPLEGKYIKYVDTFDSTPIYMKVDWIRPDKQHGDNRHTFSYTFKGFGFFGEFVGYDDATEFDWSYWFEFNIHGQYQEFRKKIESIEVIDKKEFDEAFEEMLKSLREYHYKIK